METAEVKANQSIITNEKDIEKDLMRGLQNAVFEQKEGTPNQAQNPDLVKPVLSIDKLAIKSVYKIKKSLQLKVLSRDVPDNIKPMLSHLSKVEDREAEIVKLVLDKYGASQLSPEMIEFIHKYVNTPFWPLVEMEMELYDKMKADIKKIVDDNKDKV